MAGTNPVGTWLLTLFTSMLGSTYKASIDANFAVAQRSADNFAPHPASPAAMSVIVDAGFVDAVSPGGQQTVTEVAQTTLTIAAAPSSPNNRIDLIVVDAGTGVASVIAGTPASLPVAPAIPAGKRQICQVSVPNGTAAIAAANITDLRASWGHYARGIPFAIAGGTADALTGTFTPATPTLGASQDGFIWRVRAASANATTTPTWSPDGQGPWTMMKQGGSPLLAGDIAGAGAELLLAYNYNGGTPFIELLNPAGISPFTTGDVKATFKVTADSGWVMMNDGTIGNSSSGGTTRANADTQALFELLWNNTSNSYCPVSSGRGATALADFNANKTIQLPLILGRALAASGAGAGLTSYALAQVTGENTHTLTAAEQASMAVTGTTDAVISAIASGASVGSLGSGSAYVYNETLGFTVNANGGGGAHNNMQPTTFLNIMIKL